MDFSSAAELLKICQASGIPISQAMICLLYTSPSPRD